MSSVQHLLYDQPVHHLLQRVAGLSLEHKRLVWQAYALLRRSLRPARLEPQETAQALSAQANRGLTSLLASLALKLAKAYTLQWMGARGAPYRSRKALAQEHFHLVRRHFRELQGSRHTAMEPVVPLGQLNRDRAWRAVCDGSRKSAISSAGVVVYDARLELRAEVGVQIVARTAVHAELWACIRALQTLRLFQVEHAVLEVDALSVIRAFQGRLPLHYCVEEAELLELARSFIGLEVRLVSRIDTHLADRLAAEVSRHT